MNAADIMSPVVIAVEPAAPLVQAVRLMIENRISGLPVLDAGGRAVGILTEGDLLRRVETGTAGKPAGRFAVLFMPGRLAGEYVQTHTRRVADVMTPEVISVEETTSLEQVVETMRRQRIRRVPVTRGGVVVGIVSRADMLRALAKKLDIPAAAESDAAIRDAILAELARQSWAPQRSVTIAVAGGVVEIDGVVFDLRQRDAFRVVAENVPGVKRVENRLVCVEPNTGTLMASPEDEGAEAAAREKL